MIDLATVAVIGQLNDLARDYEIHAQSVPPANRLSITSAAATLRLVATLTRDETDGYDAAYGRVWLGAGRRLLFTLITDARSVHA